VWTKLRRYLGHLRSIPAMRADLVAAKRDLAYVREALGRVENRQVSAGNIRLADKEFRVFSQWGEDGIIQHLIRNVPIMERTFVEFGVESYREANTRFLLINNNWSGLIIDSDQQHIDAITSEDLYWRYTLTAVCSFITPSNINSLIQQNGFSGQIGLLSIDIDGMDYWVWKSLTVVTPAIVVIEYNARFGPTRAVTVPLDDKFVRSAAHHSNIYYGASLQALVKLGRDKGYAFVGCNTNGNNAFFVRFDLMPSDWHNLSAPEGFVRCRFREARKSDGQLQFLSGEGEAELLAGLPLVEV